MESPKSPTSEVGTSNKCTVCNKTVYPMEQTVAESKIFHKLCFRCKTCNKALSLGGYASMEGLFFCKPCFKKTFMEKGNYSEGFGKAKPQAEWAAKRASQTLSPTDVPSSPVSPSTPSADCPVIEEAEAPTETVVA